MEGGPVEVTTAILQVPGHKAHRLSGLPVGPGNARVTGGAAGRGSRQDREGAPRVRILEDLVVVGSPHLTPELILGKPQQNKFFF